VDVGQIYTINCMPSASFYSSIYWQCLTRP